MILDVPFIARGNVDDIDFSDITTAQRTGPARWVDGQLEIQLDPEPSAAEVELIRLRLLTRDAAHEAEVATMQDALTAIDGKTGAIADGLRVLLQARLKSTLGETP